MILAIDIGNTNIKNGLFEGDTLLHSWRMSNDINKTADEYGMLYLSFFKYLGLSTDVVEGIIISSVVPNIDFTIEHVCQLYFPGRESIFVGPGIKTGIRLCYNDPRELGADRICNAVAAHTLYGGPCITVDFGTATSFGVISEEGDFQGGVICPGMKISLGALVNATARLSTVELARPPKILGKSAVQCIQSGIVYGHVGQVDAILEKLTEEMDWQQPQLIATGGMASLVVPASRYLETIDATLTLQGLRIIYQRNV